MEVITSLPVTGMVNRRGDAMRVMGREAEAVVLLEILIGSHTERGKEATSHPEPNSRTKTNRRNQITT